MALHEKFKGYFGLGGRCGPPPCAPMAEQAWGGRFTSGKTARFARKVTLPDKAVIVAELEHSKRSVFTVNVALVNPGDTVTLDGTVATEVLLLESATATPPAGAGPLRVTVPVDDVPPVALDGFNVSEVRTGGSTVIEAVCVTPLKTAEMIAVVADATGLVVTLNDVLVVPSGMVAVAGSVTDGSLLDKETTAPPVGAGPFIVTVPVEELPPVTSVGPRVTEESAALLLEYTLKGPPGH